MKKAAFSLCSALYASLNPGIALSDPCPPIIQSSCEITSPKSGIGPLYTVADGAQGTVTLSSTLNAYTKGPALLFEGRSSLSVTISPEAFITSEFQAIEVQEKATTGPINIKGTVVSHNNSAFMAQPGSQYNIVTSPESLLESLSDSYPAIFLDASASGDSTIKGRVHSKGASALSFKRTLGVSDKYPSGIHKPYIDSSSMLITDSRKAKAISFGDEGNNLISPTPPDYQFSSGTTILFDAGDLNDKTPLIHGSHIEFAEPSNIIFSGEPDLDKTYTLLSATHPIQTPPKITTEDNSLIVETVESSEKTLKVRFQEAITPIHDIQGAGDESPMKGMSVTIKGLFSGLATKSNKIQGFFLQEIDSRTDGNPATSEGIFVYYPDALALNLSVNDLVKVTGTVAEYYGETQISEVTEAKRLKQSSNHKYTATSVPITPGTDFQANAMEPLEGMRVKISAFLTKTHGYDYTSYVNNINVAPSIQFTPTQLYRPGTEATALKEKNERERMVLVESSPQKIQKLSSFGWVWNRWKFAFY